MTSPYRSTFISTLWKYPSTGGWVFARVPEKHAPRVTHPWGRTPVVATVNGHTWKTSVWRGKDGRTLLAIPKKIRGEKGDGDRMRVQLEFSSL